MSARTFVVGDIHGELDHLRRLIGQLPLIRGEDTIVFLGDYLDRGPHSKEVVRVVRALDQELGATVVCLRGNHEDAWLRVRERGWPEFVLPESNGCMRTFRSYVGGEGALSAEQFEALFHGTFFPEEDVRWMESLPYWYEDEHGIYVHAGLVEVEGQGFAHPRDTVPPLALLWTRKQKFFREYRGKRVIVGHTATELLPPELSHHTPEDPTDMWAGDNVICIDTACGNGGFLTAIELPSLTVYESR